MADRLTIEKIEFMLSELGYKLLSKEYQNVHRHIEVECARGHIRYVKINSLYQKPKCHECVSMDSMFSLDKVREFFSDAGYILISSSYRGSRYKLDVICPKKHEWSVTLNKFRNVGQRCPECSFCGGSSKMEKELYFTIQEKYPSARKTKQRHIKIDSKPYVKGFDIDIFIPEHNKGIEFDGRYFHSELGLSRSYPLWPLEDIKNYHEIKDNYFLSKGIKILHIKEQNWLDDKDKCIKECFDFLSQK